MNKNSRHPKIDYWFWNEKTIKDKQYIKDIDIVSENSTFDLLFLTQRGNINFFDPELKPYLKEAVEYAHSKNIKIGIQVWPLGFFHEIPYDIEEPAALVTEYEGVFENGRVFIKAHGKNARRLEIMLPLKSEVIFAVAFKKTGDGFYDEATYKEITSLAEVKENHDDKEELEITINDSSLDGLNVYVMVAHYYKYHDLFGMGMENDFGCLIDSFSDIPFDGFGLDEFHNLSLTVPWEVTSFRERVYGKAFHTYYAEKTGDDLIKTMFEMRFCPEKCESIRMRAINKYFDIFRHSTIKVENFVESYARKTFGDDVFIGVHNTFHNHLQNDEMWSTCCNWWEIPRRYAQTDEKMCYPVGLGIAYNCAENIVYDMYYHKDENTFFEKAVRDARFNTRVHYHAINDGSEWGCDTGSKDFLQKVEKFEEKITLLNIFEPALPKAELLVVFGFPAVCNWYPDFDARNKHDLNGKLNIMDRVKELWERGYFNILAPSDAISDKRITIKDGEFDYKGHKFKKLLYLYPQYSQKEVSEFLESAAKTDCEVKIIGDYTHNFDGEKIEHSIGKEFFIDENADIPTLMKLEANKIENGCVLEDSSVVISDYDSVKNNDFCKYSFEDKGHCYEASFRGTFAIKTDEYGKIEKLVAGNFRHLKKDGEMLLSSDGKEDYINIDFEK